MNLTDEEVHNLLRRADLRHNNRIEFDEFVKFMTRKWYSANEEGMFISARPSSISGDAPFKDLDSGEDYNAS